MNAAEQMGVIELAEARTPAAKRSAIQRLLGRGSRLDSATRERLRPAARLEPIPSVTSTVQNAHLLPAGDYEQPVMPDASAKRIRFWCQCWLQVERFTPEEAPGGLLLHGPPGTGKTMATRWISSLLVDRYPTFVMDAHDWLSSHLGESGRKLAGAFQALERSPSVLVLEEVDTVASTRGNDAAAALEMARVTTALMRLMEGARFPVIATTNRLDMLDPAVLRRFDETVACEEPLSEEKVQIVARILKGAPFDDFEPTQWSLVDLVRMARAARRRHLLQEGGAE